MECKSSYYIVKLTLFRFRWVECQLNTLRECPPTLIEIRRTLAELPETLDDTYARILEKIPKRCRNIAHCTLQLLAVSHRPLTVEEVAEATAVDYENERFDPVLHRPWDPLYILKLCSGMVMSRLNRYYLSLWDSCNLKGKGTTSCDFRTSR
jgi:hypothetical protein